MRPKAPVVFSPFQPQPQPGSPGTQSPASRCRPLTLGDAGHCGHRIEPPRGAAACRLRGLHLLRPSPLVFALHDSASTRTATVHSGGGGRFTAAKTTEGRQQTTEESCNVVPQDLCSALIYVFLLFDISMVW